jgi:DNA-binding protein H-NS
MRGDDLKSKSTDELWTLYEEVTSQLAERIATEKAKLDDRLRKIQRASNVATLPIVRRRYPKVFPKYQNPKNPAETWSGRGRQPLWVQEQLRAGKKLDRFLIGQPKRDKFLSN